MKSLLPVFLISLTLISCQKEDETPSNHTGSEKRFLPAPSDPKTIGIQLENGSTLYRNVSYGTGPLEKLDIVIPPSEEPTPLVLHFHGGAFIGGDKDDLYQENSSLERVDSLLSNGIAFATANYNLIDVFDDEDEGVFQCFRSAKKALQTLRYYKEEINVDDSRIILDGSSAGAGLVLWLGLNDEMADPISDGIMGESTRVSGILVKKPQSTYNFYRWYDDIFNNAQFGFPTYQTVDFDSLLQVPSILQAAAKFVGINNLSEATQEQIEYVIEEVDLVEKVDPSDPPLYVWNPNENEPPVYDEELGLLGEGIVHHPYHSALLVNEYIQNNGDIDCRILSLSSDPIYTSPLSYIEWIIRVADVDINGDEDTFTP